jgi:predicted Zn-dependent peptidase
MVSFAQAQEVPQLETYTLKNGVKIYLMKYGKIPAVSAKLYINTGEKNESPGQQGYGELTAKLLLQGNSKYTQEQQNDLAFKLGATLDFDVNKDNTAIIANFLSKDLDQGMDLFSSAILHPTFSKDKVDLLISQYIDYGLIPKMDVAQLADVFSDVLIYGTSNPLGRYHYKAQLKLVTPEKIKEFHAFNYTPKNASVIICGNFDSEEVKKVVEKYFGSWQSTYGEVNGVSLDMPVIKKKEIGFINRTAATQCALQWNKIAPSLKDKDLIAFNIANRIFNVVLFSEIREKGGKTYSIGAGHAASQFSNLLTISCSVRSEEMLNTINLFEVTLKNFAMANFTQEDFDKAVTGIKVGLMSSEMPANISSIYNPLLYDFNKRKNYLNDLALVKMEDVQRVIKKYFTPDVYKLVIAGDETKVAAQLNSIPGLIRYKATDIEKDN